MLLFKTTLFVLFKIIIIFLIVIISVSKVFFQKKDLGLKHLTKYCLLILLRDAGSSFKEKKYMNVYIRMMH